MRLGRLILASFTALAAYSYAQVAAPVSGLRRPVSAHESLRILQAVVPLFASVAEAAPVAPAVHPPAHSVFALEALASTLIASFAAVDLVSRRHHRSLLRC
ncbi:MAG: hypothetical protein ACRD30_10750 [Bryobacteraceae bacterium]